jgi:hypothetical protein
MIQKLHSGPGIVIGLPTLGRPVSIDWALSFKSLNPPINFNTVFQIVQNQEVGAARQAIAEMALEKKAKYLFFLGDDVVVPSHTLRNLIYRLDQDESIAVVGGVYCAKATPTFPLVFRGNGQGSYWDWKIGEFFECTGLGMDCTLIRVSALEGLSKPWFKTIDTDKYFDGLNEAEVWTEDLYFFNKLATEKPELKVYCDGGVICDHIDVYAGKKYNLPPTSLPMRQKGVIKDKKCLIIGPALDLKDDTFDVTTYGDYDGADYRGPVGLMPFDAGQFDFCVVQGLSVNFPNYIKEILRVVKSGGKISILPDVFMDYTKVQEWLTQNHQFAANKIDGNYVELTLL